MSRVQGATSDTTFELQSAFDRSQQRHVERTLWVMMMVVGLIVGGFFLASAGNAGAQASCFGAAPTLFAQPGQVLVGTSGPDVIWGSTGADIIRGGGGNDKICARGGADDVDGGSGNDQIDLGPGRDVGRGGSGNDVVNGKKGRDVISGNAGADTLSGGSGGDEVRGGKGNDVLHGDGGADVLLGNSSSDSLSGGKGRDGCAGGSGADRTSSCSSVGPEGRFRTLPPGARLPSEAECAVQVRSAREIRPGNRKANNTRGTSAADDYRNVTGFFTGTTDEIIQWASCKHGIDEDLVRAQMVGESWWRQATRGDYTSDQSVCHRTQRTSSGSCPQSVGISQIKYRFHKPAFEDANAVRSTAYNLDYALAYIRDCYDGGMGWLNNAPRGRRYAAGDVLGCMGVWFEGEWYTPRAVGYMNDVQERLRNRSWTSAEFRRG